MEYSLVSIGRPAAEVNHAAGTTGIRMKLDDKRPRSARPGASRERKLIDAAEKLFLGKGYHATTMDEVASAAGVSKKTIYLTFPSKEALFKALVHARRAPIFAPVVTQGPAEQILIETLRKSVQFIVSPKEIGMCRLVAAEGASSPALARLFHDEGKPGQLAVEQCLADLARRGEIAIDDAHEATLMLLGMAMGVMHIGLMLGVRRSPTKREIEQHVRKAVHVFLRGTARDVPRRPSAR
jgi:TetR/AcrR family transcriptional regulator of autoinduction and epiphytic fitness